ncbi:aspartyl/asparaginyl beta-hydroxylase [Paraburkholderia hospita]|uniref:Aspartyl/asparaginyl beta-hydroxylase n=1 Tax=Paraburkholderia hospita TaxID=169430 RepID=A0AAN1MMI7_9BURK|nr:hypothetical protein C2L64_31175 [Paraburkholderia hospita]EIM97631.1 aspartyl/asparaginyl beta-hydroxylase [Paraburkholderia hospita]OUL68615.1 hypothetical protein CA601_50970 [Paraburkholderia hospita]OUL75312.1 hypothetical protein CA602_36665 [Paraburkholderia hospita]SEI17224.1 hypothetical protein SAMN05192544_102940 [Paraburkholderia hospita]
MRGLFIVWFILSVAYVARRGNARFTFGRQLSDQEGDRTGFLNRAFKYVYAIRRVGKHLKAWHRPTYYAVKWVLFGSIFAGIAYAL